MNVKESLENDTITAYVSGEIDGSNVGDFEMLPRNIMYYIPKYDAIEVANQLENISMNEVIEMSRKAKEYALLHFDTKVVKKQFKKWCI